METVEKYVVNPDTMALLPIDGPQGELWTLALETNAHFKVTITPFKIIDYSCSYFGSTYAGRKGSASLMGYKSLPPICVCNELGIFLFPLTSVHHRDCIWLAHSHIKHWESVNKDMMKVRLTNADQIEVPMHANAFLNRVFRTAQFRHQLNEKVTYFKFKKEQIKESATLQPEVFIRTDLGTYKIGKND